MRSGEGHTVEINSHRDEAAAIAKAQTGNANGNANGNGNRGHSVSTTLPSLLIAHCSLSLQVQVQDEHVQHGKVVVLNNISDSSSPRRPSTSNETVLTDGENVKSLVPSLVRLSSMAHSSTSVVLSAIIYHSVAET